MLKSVDSVSFSKGIGEVYTVCEHHYRTARTALESLKMTGKNSKLYKVKGVPFFLNGEPSTKAEILKELEKHKSKDRTCVRLVFCTDESQGFERAISVRIFPSWAAFKRSPYHRNFSYFTDTQREEHKLLTENV